MPDEPQRGLLDTNILILRHGIDPEELPDEMAISAITLAELSAGVHLVSGNDARAADERARRAAVLQRVENEFDPLPFDADAARIFGRISAAVQARGRTPRRRIADLMIASVSTAAMLPLYTTNPDDFDGLDGIVRVIPVNRPSD
ncbi:type II toxin-antitoxin system VapC family toxin [Millisia brevis]|uniref:type II toxin-antitoxin system VapC family toxin n=1 Tax=Millisia brevis TaxID=264148 RepID=UPI00082ECC45|nr:type II toxin-antitoxin system VapC family toxin [Millisia brevis]